MEVNVAKIDGLSVVVITDPAFKQQAEWLLEVFRNLHANGAELREGVRVQVGWSILTLRQHEENQLIVCEPDFSNDPFTQEVESIRWTFEITARQNSFAERCGASQQAISFQDKIIMEKNVLSRPSLVLSRIAPVPERGDSGWYFADRECRTGTPELEAIYAYQLLAARPGVIEALTLPEGYMVSVEGSQITSVANPQDEVTPLYPA
jgi:hypothetical protein